MINYQKQLLLATLLIPAIITSIAAQDELNGQPNQPSFRASLAAVLEHRRLVGSVQQSPDETRILTVGADNSTRVWDPSTSPVSPASPLSRPWEFDNPPLTESQIAFVAAVLQPTPSDTDPVSSVHSNGSSRSDNGRIPSELLAGYIRPRGAVLPAFGDQAEMNQPNNDLLLSIHSLPSVDSLDPHGNDRDSGIVRSNFLEWRQP